MAVADYYFWLVGPFQIWQGEARLDTSLPGSLTKELLGLLLLEHDRYVPAERLIETFWPRLDPAAAANNLQVNIRKLRRWLEPGLRRGRDSRFVLTETHGYRFALSGCRLDSDEFAQAAQQGQAALRSGELAAARAALERARTLYRGELLSDLPYAEWAFTARAQLREAHLQALEALADVYLKQGLPAETGAVCRQALALDPLRESVIRRLMHSHAALGRPAEALTAFDALQRLLRDELGAAPAAETQGLRDAIAAGRVSPGAAASQAAAAPALDLPLAGRDGVLAQLRGAAQGGCRLALLAGEAGLGKTRLLAEFTAAWPGRVYPAQARASAPPFAAALDLFEAYLQAAPPAERLAALGPLGPPLAQHAPALREHWPGCPPYAALTPEAEQQRLHQAVLAGLRLAGGEAPPAVFVLDDLHWADAASLAVLADLLRQPHPAGLLCAFRGEDVEAGSPAAGWLAEQRGGAHPPLEVALAPLAAADVLALVRAVAGLPDPLPFSQRLHAATGGHPLFVAETLRGLLEAGWLFADEQGAWHASVPGEQDDLPLTPTLREAVLARVARLDALERETLDAAAVLRPRGQPAVLAAMLHVAPDRLDAALQALSARRLLAANRAGEWEFAHHLIGEVVSAELAPAHRRLLHRLAAGALAAAAPLAPGPEAAEVVRHLTAGATEPDTLPRWAVAAGQWALEQFDYAQARRHFELAEACLKRAPEAAEQLGLAVYEGLGMVLASTSQPQLAVDTLARALAHAAAPRDRARLRLAQTQICARDTGEFDRALALLAEAEAELADLDEPAMTAEAHTVLATIHYGRGDYAAGERAARLAVARAAGTPLEYRALQSLSINLQRLGELDEAMALYRRVVALCEATGNLRGTAVAYVNLGNGHQALGQLAEAYAAYDRASETFARLGHRRDLSIVYANVGLTALAQGRLDQAEHTLRQSMELALNLGARFTVALAAHVLAQALALRGRAGEAVTMFERSLAEAAAISARTVEAQARLNYARWVHWLRGDAAATRAQAAAALEVGEALNDNHCRREGRLLLGEVLLAEGDVAAAEAAAQEAHAIATAARQVFTVGRAERLLAQAAAAREDFEAASAHLDTAERIFRQAGAQIELGQTCLARAEAARAAGEPPAAWRPWLLEAVRLFRRARATPLLKQAQSRLRAG